MTERSGKGCSRNRGCDRKPLELSGLRQSREIQIKAISKTFKQRAASTEAPGGPIRPGFPLRSELEADVGQVTALPRGPRWP